MIVKTKVFGSVFLFDIGVFVSIIFKLQEVYCNNHFSFTKVSRSDVYTSHSELRVNFLNET